MRGMFPSHGAGSAYCPLLPRVILLIFLNYRDLRNQLKLVAWICMVCSMVGSAGDVERVEGEGKVQNVGEHHADSVLRNLERLG